MNKYIDADKLIAEIEKRRKERIEVNEKINKGEIYTETEDDFNRTLAHYGNRLVYQELFEIICFIQFLQQEQPEVDLEKEMDKFYGIYRDKTGKTYAIEDDEPCFDWKGDGLAESDMRIARHFFELGLNARKEDTK